MRLTEAAAHRTARRLVYRAVLTVAVGIVGITVAVGLAGGTEDVVDAIKQLDLRWLGAGLVAEAVSYALLAVVLRRLAGPDIDLGRGDAMRLSLVIFGLGVFTPASPAEGLVLGAAELQQRGLDRRRSVLALAFAEWFGTGTLWALAAFNVLVAVAVGHLPGTHGALLVVAAATVLVVLAGGTLLATRQRVMEVAAAVVDRVCFWRERRTPVERRASVARLHAQAGRVAGTRRQRVLLAIVAGASWLADALCLAAGLAAAGVSVPPDILLLAYTAGIVASQVPLLPAGLGLVEAAMPAVLHRFGVAYPNALAGALAYRAFGTFVPAGAGAVALPSLHLIRRPPAAH